MPTMHKSVLVIALCFCDRALAAQSTCEPSQVAAVLSDGTKSQWNQGTARSWDVKGDLWSMPVAGDVRKLAHELKKRLEGGCDVSIYDSNSLTIRVLPKQVESVAEDKHARNTPTSLISPVGTTIGVFAPSPHAMMLIMYPAKIAAAIARGTGTTPRKDLKEVFAKFPAELDIEYNFGMFTVSTFGGTGTLTMRQAADIAFSDLRKQGYTPAPGSQKQISAFDHFFAPDRHESFWIKKDGMARVELEKLKNGKVRINIHEDKDRSIGTRS